MLATLLLAAITPSAAAAVAPRPPDLPTVTTIAGSGIAGIADGPAASARFLMPAGLAYGPGGTLFVSDEAGQRIRSLRGGVVRTVAGGGPIDGSGLWVAPGYRDGPAGEARFNRPVGLAVDRGGAVYVADEGNHAIRKIAGGAVTTVAGAPARATGVDGPAATAGFAHPRAVAVDDDGSLYVADTGVGLRRVDPAGNVTTYKVELIGSAVLDVTRVQGAHEVVVADGSGLTAVAVPSGTPIAHWAGAHAEGDVSFGTPTSVAPIDALRQVYTDAYTHALRYLAFSPSSNYARLLSADTTENGQIDGGGFQDGPGAQARFDTPLAVRADPAGGFSVADAGNKRIRHVSPFDPTSGDTPPDFSLGDRAREYRLAVLGNSFAFTGTAPGNALAGRIGDALEHDPAFARSGKRVRFYSIRKYGISGASARDYVREFLADGEVDCVVLLVNSQWINAVAGRPGRGLSQDLTVPMIDTLAQQLAAIASDAKAAHLAVVVAAQPFPFEVSPLEQVLAGTTGMPSVYVPQESDDDYTTFHDRFVGALRSSGLPLVDGWSVFRAETAAPSHRPLYGSRELHLGPHGDAVLGAAIARAIVQSRLGWVSPGAGASR